MRDYEELVERLREADEKSTCGECGMNLHGGTTKKGILFADAADAIEELQKRVELEYQSGFADGQRAANRKKNKWISVEDALPEDNKAVNVVWINRSPVIYYQHIKDKPQVATAVHYRGQWYWWSAVVQDYLEEYGKWDCDKMDDAIEVTHWMPLPEPPKEDKP